MKGEYKLSLIVDNEKNNQFVILDNKNDDICLYVNKRENVDTILAVLEQDKKKRVYDTIEALMSDYDLCCEYNFIDYLMGNFWLFSKIGFWPFGNYYWSFEPSELILENFMKNHKQPYEINERAFRLIESKILDSETFRYILYTEKQMIDLRNDFYKSFVIRK